MYTLSIHGQLLSLHEPQVMGILNITPDSFYSGSRTEAEDDICRRLHQLMDEGADMIDVGAYSTRPGADDVSEEEEMERLRRGLRVVRREFPDVPVSVDTFRADVARMAVEEFGADISNDGSEGGITGRANVPLEAHDGIPEMFAMMGKLQVPYILMSVKPSICPMMKAFAQEVEMLHDLGVKDIILDPGFGFGKTLDDNYLLLKDMDKLQEMRLPVLVGVSRKTMIFKLFGYTPNESLNGTTIINTIALQKGAAILRVHDVKEAVECITIFEKTR